MKFIEHSYNDLHNYCVEYARLLGNSDIQFEAIIALARGGTFPGTILSHILNLPMETIHYSSAIGKGETKYNSDVSKLPQLTYKKILIVDDVCDSGNSLNEVVTWYEQQGLFVGSYAIYYRDFEHSVHSPNYSIHLQADDPWVLFPWEKEMIDV